MIPCNALVLLFSALETVLFVSRTHTRRVDDWGEDLELFSALLFAFSYAASRLEAGLQPSSALGPAALVDVVTVAPVLWPRLASGEEAPAGVRWLSLKYLRIYSALHAFERFQEAVELDRLSEFARRVLVFCLRFVACVVCMAGTVYVLEALGELPGLADSFISTAMGELSFLQMNYWIITTISTVGYGDFSPKTVPSRLMIIIFIVGGIVFFSSETSELLDLQKSVSSGRGSYSSGFVESPHVLVVGRGAAKFNSMLEAFVLETLGGPDGPDLVFLSGEAYDAQLLQFVREELPPRLRRRVWLLIGNVMSRTDMDRVRLEDARMAIIIPDIRTRNSAKEDSENMLRALDLQRAVPRVRLRLMLLAPESQARAVHLGIPRYQCFSAHELKAAILMNAARIRGFATLLAGLMQEPGEAQGGAEAWRREYRQGLRARVCGFLAGPRVAGRRFHEAAAGIHAESGGRVLLIAAQHASRGLLLNCGDGLAVVRRGQVLIAVALCEADCLRFAEDSGDWRTALLQARLDAGHGLSGGVSHYDLGGVSQAGRPPQKSPGGVEQGDAGAGGGGGAGSACSAGDSPQPVDAPQPGHVLLLVLGCSGTTWEEVVSCLTTVRDTHLPSQSLAVFSAAEAPDTVVSAFEGPRCCFMHGKVLRLQNLVEAGIESVGSLVVLRGQASKETLLVDCDVITLSGMIEQLFVGRVPPLAIYEFGSTQGVNLANLDAGCVPCFQYRSQLAEEHVANRIRGLREEFLAKLLQVANFCLGGLQEHGQAVSKLLHHPLFAAGQAFSPEFFGGMLGHFFRFPGSIEFVEALAMPGRRHQECFAWQVRCPPEWQGRNFGELVQAWALGTDAALDCGPSLPLALFREPAPGYNFTLPGPQTELLATDLVTALGPPGFGWAMARRGLLHAAGT